MENRDKKLHSSSVVYKHTSDELKELQSLSLDEKIKISSDRIMEWYVKHDNKCYVSFSGGKDSTVLAYLTARVCKLLDCKLTLWYSDTGLEFPELKQHVKTFSGYLIEQFGIEVETIIDYPKDKNGNRVTFKDVILSKGYPVISKEISRDVGIAKSKPDGKTAQKFVRGSEYHQKYGDRWLLERWNFLLDSPFNISAKCCSVMKKEPSHSFQKETGLVGIIGTMADESNLRKKQWLITGCNAFDATYPTSKPLSFWTEQDIYKFIVENNIPIPSVYGEIKYDERKQKYYPTLRTRTGCMFCAYGAHLEKEPNRFQLLKQTHPKIWEYCMKPVDEGGLGMKEVLEFINVKTE